jgi:hypothetical protein
MILRVRCRNCDEWNLAEKMLFILGYKWIGMENQRHLEYSPNSTIFISVWPSGNLKYGSNPTFYEEYRSNMTFEDFIDYIDNNDIKIKNPQFTINDDGGLDLFS